jgi:hypothetical protein
MQSFYQEIVTFPVIVLSKITDFDFLGNFRLNVTKNVTLLVYHENSRGK